MSIQVSIIVPCFNSEYFVEKAVESALNQSGINKEVIVVDDGSTDGSLSVLEKFGSRIKLIQLGQNRGACFARNKAINVAKGKFIKFLDSDDLLEYETLSSEYQRSSNCPHKVLFGDHKLLNAETNDLDFIYRSHLMPGEKLNFASLFSDSPLISESLYPTRLVRNAGGFNLKVKRGQEHDLNIRLYLSGVDFVYYPGARFTYRNHKSVFRISVASRSKNFYRDLENIETLIALAESSPRSFELSDIRKCLGRHLWRIGRQKARENCRELSETYFSKAKNLARTNSAVGGKTYKYLARVFPPYQLEMMLSYLKKILR